MGNGPLIPGLKEFDGPRRGVPRVLWVLLGVVVVAALGIVFIGVFAGAGPMKSLGTVTDDLQTVAFRPTTEDAVVQVAVALPPEGLCSRDPVTVDAIEGPDTVSVSASVTSLRNSPCDKQGGTGDEVWVDVLLDLPLGQRVVVRSQDGQELPRQTAANLGG